MDIKTKIIGSTFLLFVSIFLCSCDPEMSTSYKIKNNSAQDFTINLHEFGNAIPEILDNGSGTKTEIYGADLAGNPGFFGEVARFDLIEISYENDNEIVTFYWSKPEGRGYIIPESDIGQVRDDVPLDIYNRDNWELTISGDDESWIFTINEEDLELFE